MKQGATADGFSQRKASALSSLTNENGDKSRKGSVDAPIVHLVELVNSHPSIFTTSSCSGRLSVFGEPNRNTAEQKKKGGEWVYATHNKPDGATVIAAITKRLEEGKLECPLVLRFEPFILAVECEGVKEASRLVNCGRDSGFRESGITFGSQRILATVRSSTKLEVPLVMNNKLLVSLEYIEYVVGLARERFEANALRIGKFAKAVQEQLFNSSIPDKCLNLDQSVEPRSKPSGPDHGLDLNLPSLKVKWELMSLKGTSHKALKRWGHSSCVVGNYLVVFGGFGGDGAHKRLNDLQVHNPKTDLWDSPVLSGSIPSPRMGHACVSLGEQFLIIGGRHGPSVPLNDTYLCTPQSNSWNVVRIAADRALPGLFRHSAISKGNIVVVFGGWSLTGPQNSTWKLDSGTWIWELVKTAGEVPAPRMSHTACVVGDTMYVHGGFSEYEMVYSDLYGLDLKEWRWSRIATVAQLPMCYSHSLTAVGEWMVLLGGCPKRKTSALTLVHPKTGTVKDVSTQIQNGQLVPVRHTCDVVQGRLFVVGGGAFCFSFGSVFGQAWTLSIRSLLRQMGKPTCVHSWVFWSRKEHAKEVKDELKAVGWLDSSVKSSLKGNMIGLPVTAVGAANLQDSQTIISRESSRPNKNEGSSMPISECLRTNLARGGCVEMVKSHKSQPKPNLATKSSVVAMIKSLLMEDGKFTDEEASKLCLELPKKWEKLGDMILIPEDSMTAKAWTSMGESVWKTLAKGLGASRLARQRRISSAGTRDSQATLLFGLDGWVQHKESGVTFTLDITRCMFSSGNVTERTRMGKLDCSGETVVDLFAGIGYYTIPILCKAKAAVVHACEWNQYAMEGLRMGLDRNNVGDKCVVHEGDCQEVAPIELGDRVILGLLPSSDCGWRTAVKALKLTGGWLHVHSNVLDKNESMWKVETLDRFRKLSKDLERDWSVELVHCERVKWYAPHIRHLVLDIKCTPQ